MRLFGFMLSQAAFVGLALIAFGQATSPSALTAVPTARLKGVVIEEETDGSSRPGETPFREGDVLLSWSLDRAEGSIASPFALRELITEEVPRGVVRIEGLRGSEARIWMLDSDASGIRSRPNLPASLLAIYLEGRQLAHAGNVLQAVERWRAAAMQVQEPSSEWIRPWFLSRAAELLASARKWKEADDLYQAASEHAKGTSPEILANLLEDWAKTFDVRKDWIDAEKYRQQALAARRRSGSGTIGISLNLTYLGLFALRRGDLSTAEEYCREALAIQEKIAPRSLHVAASLVNLGVLSDRRGDLVKAEENYRRALAVVPPGRSDFKAAILNNLGTIAETRGDAVTAQKYYQKALEIDQDSYSAVKPLSNLGEIARERGDIDKAERYYKQALVNQEKHSSDDIGTARILNKLGNVALDRGNLTQAEAYQRQALAIAEKSAPGSHDVAWVLSSLADVMAERGDLAGAQQYHERALAMYEAIAPQSPRIAVILNRLGDVLRDRHDLTRAEEYYRRALAIREKLLPDSKDLAETLAALAGIMRSRQQHDVAAQLYERALHVLDNQVVRLGVGEEDRYRFRSKYLSYYRDYVDLVVQKDPAIGFQVLESSRARSLLETLTAADVDIRKGVDPELVSRERSLRESINAKSNRRIQLLNGKYTEEQAASDNKELEALLTQYEDVEEQIRLRSPNYGTLIQPQPLTPKEIQQLLDSETLLLEYALDDKRSYVFAVTADSLTAYELPAKVEITKAARRLHDLLSAQARPWQKSENGNSAKAGTFSKNAEIECEKASAVLSKMVLGPVWSLLKRKRLVIVPDGALQYISFAALPDLSNSAELPGIAGAGPEPLVISHEIVTLPSASVLKQLRDLTVKRATPPKTVAVLADPVFSAADPRLKNQNRLREENSRVNSVEQAEPAPEKNLSDSVTHTSFVRSASEVGLSGVEQGLARLPFSRREAAAIRSLAPPEKRKEALDFDASRATVLSTNLSEYRIVHFATHGLLNSTHPELSGLVLSLVDEDGRQQNGFLDLQDIYNLNLSAELVVLSACKTALGQEIQGEGLVGITRGFMHAGAPRVLATLWEVDDAAAAQLMAKFYQGMLKDGLRPAAALRRAQIETWRQKRWKAPYYWAAFVIQGDW